MPHTPGPWTIAHCAGGYIIEQDRDMNHRIVRGSGGIRNYYDAMLISAAPQLLEAAKHAMRILQENGLLNAASILEDAIAEAGITL